MSKFSGRKLELSIYGVKQQREIGSRNWDNKWRKLGLKILERDDYTCQYCGYRYEKYLNCHHIDGDSENNDLENIVVVCIDCHFILHSYYAINVNRLEIFYSSKYSQVEIITKTRSLRIDGNSDEDIIKLLDLGPVNIKDFRRNQIEEYWEDRRQKKLEEYQGDVKPNFEKVVGFVRHWKYDTRYKNYVKGKSKSKDNKTTKST